MAMYRRLHGGWTHLFGFRRSGSRKPWQRVTKRNGVSELRRDLLKFLVSSFREGALAFHRTGKAFGHPLTQELVALKAIAVLPDTTALPSPS